MRNNKKYEKIDLRSVLIISVKFYGTQSKEIISQII